MYLVALIANNMDPNQTALFGAVKESSLIRVHSVCFCDKISLSASEYSAASIIEGLDVV